MKIQLKGWRVKDLVLTSKQENSFLEEPWLALPWKWHLYLKRILKLMRILKTHPFLKLMPQQLHFHTLEHISQT